MLFAAKSEHASKSHPCQVQRQPHCVNVATDHHLWPGPPNFLHQLPAGLPGRGPDASYPRFVAAPCRDAPAAKSESSKRSWLPATTTLCLWGCAASQVSWAWISAKVPYCERSPACTRLSPGGSWSDQCCVVGVGDADQTNWVIPWTAGDLCEVVVGWSVGRKGWHLDAAGSCCRATS